MTGKITINPGASLTGSLPASVSLAGSGTYISTADGNVFYGTTPFDYSAFTGTIKLTTGRWMSQSYFEKPITFDVSKDAQVWIQGGKTVAWDFVLHDPGTMSDGLGLLRVDGNGTNITGNISISGNSRISVRFDRNTATDTVSGVISGSGKLVYSMGSQFANTHATLVLNNVNTYTGGTTVMEGTLELQGNGVLGAGNVEILRDTVVRTEKEAPTIHFTPDSGVLSFNKSTDYTFTNTFSGNGFLQQAGAGKLTFNSATTSFSGGFNLKNGSVDFGTLTSLDSFNYYGSGSIAGGNLTINSFNLLSTSTYANVTSLVNALTFAAAGTLPNVGDGGVLSVTNSTDLASAVTGFTTSGTGIIQYSGSSFEINDGNSPYTFSASTTFTEAGLLNCAAETATIVVADTNTVKFSQGINESIAGQALTKQGAGTLTLNSVGYTGKTTVQAGTLKILANSVSTSLVQVDSGAVLNITEGLFESNPKFSGTGTIVFRGGDGGEILNTTNSGGFKGTIEVTGKTRFRNYALAAYSGVTFDISEGAQFWVGQGINLNNNFILSGTADTYTDGRGVFRFDYAATNATMPVVTGTVQLAGDTRVSTIAGDLAGFGMFAGVISGTGKLEKHENFTIASNPLNARLILAADNTYSGGTSIVTGTIQLGYSGTMNGVTYDGTKGSLGTGALSIAAPAALDYNRTNTYNYAGAVTNAGTMNVNSGTLALSGAVTNSGNVNVSGTLTTTGAVTAAAGTTSNINVLAGGVYNAYSAVTLGNADGALAKGVHSINLNGDAAKDAVLNSKTTLTNAKITGNEYSVWNFQLSSTDDTTASIADASAFEGTINLIGYVNGSGAVQNTRWRPGAANLVVDWSNAEKVVVGGHFELYMKSMTINGNIELGNSTGYDSGAGIRIDGGGNSNVLNGTLTLRTGETGVVNLKNTGGNLLLNSAVTGSGNFSLKADSSNGSNVMTLTSKNNDYTGTTTVSNATFKLASGAKVQANGTITLRDATAKYIVSDGATLAVGTDAAAAGTTLNITGTGALDLSGTLALDVFSANNYDILDLTGLTTADLNGATIELDLAADLDKSSVMEVDWFKGFTPDWSQMELQLNGSGFLVQILANGNLLLGSTDALPEPAAWMLLLLSLGFIPTLRRRMICKA